MGQSQHLLTRWTHACSLNLVASYGRKAFGAQHEPHVVSCLRIGLIKKPVPTVVGNDSVFGAPQPQSLAIVLGFLFRANVASQAAGECLADCADIGSHAARRQMMTGDKPPQSTILDDRDGRRRRNAHVLEILKVDGRHAAKCNVAHVDIRSTEQIRAQWRGLIGHVGNTAYAIANVQGTRLERNVAGGEVMIEERMQVRCLRLCDNAAGVIVEEAVDHHPVKARRFPEQQGRVLA